MVAPVVANLTTPVGIVLIDPTTGLPYSASGGIAGSYLAYASATGTLNNVNPPGFSSSVGFLDVTLPSGNATWTGLIAGSNAQQLTIANSDSVNSLTLAALNAGSSAANQFRNSSDLILPPLTAISLVYYTTPAQWIIA